MSVILNVKIAGRSQEEMKAQDSDLPRNFAKKSLRIRCTFTVKAGLIFAIILAKNDDSLIISIK